MQIIRANELCNRDQPVYSVPFDAYAFGAMQSSAHKKEKSTLMLRFRVKPGAMKHHRALLRNILDECEKEPAFIAALVHTAPERPDEVFVYEIWKGSHEQFNKEQMPKAYRKAFIEANRQFVEGVDVEWSTPVEEWGTSLLDA